jgi:hypothetical protein
VSDDIGEEVVEFSPQVAAEHILHLSQELSKMPTRRRRPASSRGARRISSDMARVIEAIHPFGACT